MKGEKECEAAAADTTSDRLAVGGEEPEEKDDSEFSRPGNAFHFQSNTLSNKTMRQFG